MSSFSVPFPALWLILMCLLNDNTQFDGVSRFWIFLIYFSSVYILAWSPELLIRTFLLCYRSFQLASPFLASSLNVLKQSVPGCLMMMLGILPLLCHLDIQHSSWSFLNDCCQGRSVPETYLLSSDFHKKIFINNLKCYYLPVYALNIVLIWENRQKHLLLFWCLHLYSWNFIVIICLGSLIWLWISSLE